MGIKRIVLTISCIFFVSSAFAVLPPIYQSMKEFKALVELLDSEKGIDLMGVGNSITKIERTEKRNYKIYLSNDCYLLVIKEIQESEILAGPENFILILPDTAVCRRLTPYFSR